MQLLSSTSNLIEYNKITWPIQPSKAKLKELKMLFQKTLSNL